ncbi:MAG: hypothetical protein JW958_04620 [Candidatus Eisenbacteria bacterium]|nr:hypothetical protein [Candidatus Eisenbacteria bacterium]
MTGPKVEISREEAAEIIARLNRKRRIQIVGLAIAVLATFLALLSRVMPMAVPGLSFSFWGPLAAVLLLAKLVLFFAAWRCPKCGASLGSSYRPRFCPGCGIALVDAGDR